MQSTSVRIDAATHEEFKRLAVELHTTVGHTVTLAVRVLRQDRAGAELATPLNARPRGTPHRWEQANAAIGERRSERLMSEAAQRRK